MKHVISKKSLFVATLLSATALTILSSPAVACPIVTGTVSGSGGGCYFSNQASDVTVMSTGYIHGGAEKGIVYNNSTGSITNDGIIDGAEGAIVVENNSTIGSITNNSDINSSGYSWSVWSAENGINISSSTVSGSITNSGLIAAGRYGIYVQDGASVGDIINDGTITAYYGIGVHDSTVDGSITNESIINSNGSAIEVYNSIVEGDVINKGVVSGDHGDISIWNNSVIRGDVVNTGSIERILIGDSIVDGDVVNNGDVMASYNGLSISSSTVNAIENGINGHLSAMSIGNTEVKSGIKNLGEIVADSGIEFGIGIYGSNSIVTNGIINDNLIDGAEGGISVAYGAEVDFITNRGEIRDTQGGYDGRGIYITDAKVTQGINNSGTISGDWYSILIENPVDRIVVNNSGTLNGDVRIDGSTLNINSGSIVNDMISGTGGILNINTGFSTVHNYELQNINLNSGIFSANNNNNFTVTDKFSLAGGTLAVAEGKTVTVTGDYTQSAASTLRLQANSPALYGQLNVTGDADFDAGTNIFVDVTNGAAFAQGSRLNNVVTAGTLNASTFTVNDNSHLFNFSSLVDGNHVHLLMNSDKNTSIEKSVIAKTNTPARGAAVVLDQIIANPTGDMIAVADAFAALPNEQSVSKAASQTLPTLTGGSAQAVMNTLDTTSRIIQSRQEGNLGLSSGDEAAVERRFWLKPFGSWSNQDTRNNVTGFSADSYGMVAGGDNVVTDNLRLGLAVAYANTSLDSNDSLNKVDVNGYSAIFYGSYGLDARTDINFQADLGYNANDSRRIINFGGLNRVAKGDFNSYSGHLGAGIGRMHNMTESTSITPSVRMDYYALQSEKYTESGAGGLNLNVDSQFTDQLIPAAEVKLNHNVGDDFSVTANAGVGYDVLNGPNSVTSSFVGGGSTFTTTGLKPSPWVVRSGLGINYDVNDALEIGARYDREDRGRSFDNQTFTVKARMEF